MCLELILPRVNERSRAVSIAHKTGQIAEFGAGSQPPHEKNLQYSEKILDAIYLRQRDIHSVESVTPVPRSTNNIILYKISFLFLINLLRKEVYFRLVVPN